jgi:predicted ABC-type exoprotein transport system permease subunit
MNLINYLAEIWGVSIVVVSLALLVKEKHLKSLLAKIETDESLFLWGFISLIIGLAMVLSYNVWEQSWHVIITILGWLALLKGLVLLFMPEYVKKWAKQIGYQQWFSVCMIILLFIGLIITYFGFVS